VPASAVDADRYLPGERPFRDLAIKGGTGKPGAGQNGLHTDDTIRIVHGAVLSSSSCCTRPQRSASGGSVTSARGLNGSLRIVGVLRGDAGGLWRSVAEQGGNWRRTNHAMGPDQIFSHRVPRTRRSAFRGPRFTRPGAWFRPIRSWQFLQAVKVCPPVISLRQTIPPRKGGGTEVPLCTSFACLGISVPPDRSFLTAFWIESVIRLHYIANKGVFPWPITH